MTMNIEHKNLWIALYSSVLSGTSTVRADSPADIADLSAKITDEALKVIASRWPDLPKDYSMMLFGQRS